jgi:hypothetical protein
MSHRDAPTPAAPAPPSRRSANADAAESIAWTQLGSPAWGDQIALLRDRLRCGAPLVAGATAR